MQEIESDNPDNSRDTALPKIKKRKRNPLAHGPLQYGKKFYFVEYLAERLIQLVSFVSILAILAIFYYVFQESRYAFISPETTTVSNVSNQNSGNTSGNKYGNSDQPAKYNASVKNDLDDNSLKQETYNPDNSSQSDKPETYSPDSPAESSPDLKPESYSPDNSSANSSELKPESYSPDNSVPVEKEKKSSKSSKSDRKSVSENNAIAEKKENTDKVIADKPKVINSVKDSPEEKLNVQKFILPNDYIDNKPQYVWQPVGTTAKYSFIPLFAGALKVTLIGLIIGAPIAILAAIFTVAFAPRWLKEILKPSIEILAGFPSVVVGFFCLITLATVIQNVFHTTFRLNAFVGGIGMSLAIIPIIYTVTEDALTSVPKHLKEASLALGATRWETAWRVMLPAATPGVFAALILGFGRAFGETMIALMATGNAALVSADIFESVRTMAATIGSEMAEVEFHGVHYGVLFLIGAVLFVVTFALNAIAEFWVRKRLLRRFQGN